jgi:glycosyltransferase involved in cell wall biosynthesis
MTLGSDPQRHAVRVCFVSHSGMDGGAQRSLVDLIDALTPHGVESRVVVPEGGFVASALQVRAVPYVVYRYWPWTGEIPLPWWDRFFKKPLVHLLRAVALSRIIRRWQCDVIVSNTLTVCEGALAARILRLPHITHAREFGDLDHGHHFEQGPWLSVRLLSALSARVVFNSAALAKHYRRQVPSARSRVIYNAVSVMEGPGGPVERATPRAAGGTLSCVLVGHLIPGKGHEDAIRAIADLSARGRRVNLKLVGGSGLPAYKERLQRLIRSLGVSSLVEMVGHVPDPQRSFLEANVALMCSRMEAFGRVTVEAMKLGRAVVGARSGGTPEIIRDGFNGFLYAPGNARDLADKIEQIARDPDGARRMGERARRFATDMFSLERYGGEFMDLLREVHEESARRVPGFWSRLPALPSPGAVDRAIHTSLRGRTRRRQAQVLVVDDDPLITQWLVDSLTAEGHDVDVAGDGRTAMTQLEQGSYDLIVSDLRMPEVDGVALYRRLERERPQAARRMLFLTGNTDVAEYRDFLAEKRDRTLAKPVDLIELNRLAGRILAIPTD